MKGISVFAKKCYKLFFNIYLFFNVLQEPGHTCNFSTGESEVRGHFFLSREFKAIMGNK